MEIDKMTAYESMRGSDRVTKEQFRKTAMSAIDSCLAVSDEIWEQSLVTVAVKFMNNYEVVVGVRDTEEPDDFDAQATIDALSLKMKEYEEALRQIASDDRLPAYKIAAAALGENDVR